MSRYLVALMCVMLTVAAFSCGRSQPQLINPGFPFPSIYLEIDFDVLAEAPVEVQVTLVANAVVVDSLEISWGDSATWEPVDASLQCSHVYNEAGEYTITARGIGTTRGDPAQDSRTVRVGRVVRPYTDPISGETYDIVDGVAIVCFVEWERLSGLDHDMAEEPDIAAFLVTENLDVYDEWPTIASMVVVLPGDTTVEEAVAEWPQRYPELIEAVEPNSISEPMEGDA
jgi:hypothetical protein